MAHVGSFCVCVCACVAQEWTHLAIFKTWLKCGYCGFFLRWHIPEKSTYTHEYILSWGYGWCSTFMFPKMVKILLEKYWTLDFSSFWEDLGFGGCASCCWNLISKRIEKCVGQLLAGSWFWWLLFPVQLLIGTVLKTWFSQLLARSWFWRLRFTVLFLKVFTNCFFQLLLGCWFWRLLFPAHLLKKCFYTQTYFISWGCGWCSTFTPPKMAHTREKYLYTHKYIGWCSTFMFPKMVNFFSWKSIEQLIFPAFGRILVLVAVLFVIEIWSRKIIINCFFVAFGRILVWWLLFSCEIFTWKSIEKLIFPAFGRNVGFGGCFVLHICLKNAYTQTYFTSWGCGWCSTFTSPKMAHTREKYLYTHKYILSWGYGWCSTFTPPKMAHTREKYLCTHKYILSWGCGWCSTFMFPKMVKFFLKKYWTIDFSSFWQDLGFGGCAFCYWNLISKNNNKLFYCSFWQDLGLVTAFFLWNFYLKKYWKIDFSSFWQECWFWRLLCPAHLLEKCLYTNVFHILGVRMMFHIHIP